MFRINVLGHIGPTHFLHCLDAGALSPISFFASFFLPFLGVGAIFPYSFFTPIFFYINAGAFSPISFFASFFPFLTFITAPNIKGVNNWTWCQ